MLIVIEIGKDKEGKTLYIVFETRMSREFFKSWFNMFKEKTGNIEEDLMNFAEWMHGKGYYCQRVDCKRLSIQGGKLI